MTVYRPRCFYVIQLRLGDLMCRIGRQRVPIRKTAMHCEETV